MLQNVLKLPREANLRYHNVYRLQRTMKDACAPKEKALLLKIGIDCNKYLFLSVLQTYPFLGCFPCYVLPFFIQVVSRHSLTGISSELTLNHIQKADK